MPKAIVSTRGGPTESFDVMEFENIVRGAAAGKTFVALQNVLDALADVDANGYSHAPNQAILDAIDKAFG